MREKLRNQGIAIGMSLGKQQHSGGKAINAMHGENSLSPVGEVL
jgi:hypothetical protein